MKHRLLLEEHGRRMVVVTLDIGDEVVECLTRVANELKLGASQITAIGGFERLRLGYFDFDRREFHSNALDEQVELLSMVGNIAMADDGTRKLHLHVVVGRRDATTRGGHLVEAMVRPTLEALIEESPAHLHRRHDAATGLVLLKP